MISLFTQVAFPNSTRLTFPRFSYVEDRLKYNHQMVQQYYEFNQPAVRSNHSLVVLLNSLLIPTSMHPQRYVELCNQAAYSIGRSLGMGSAIYAGRLQDRSWFYGPNVKEFIFLTGDNDINLNVPWHSLECIRVVSHPKSDLSFRLQDGQYTSNESGYAVLEINAGIMAYQFIRWKQQQKQIAGEAMGARHFVMKYVLPQLLKSHIDVVLLNRLANALSGTPNGINLRSSPLRVPESTTFVNEVIDQMTKVFTDRNLRFDEILNNIPLPFSGNALRFFKVPDVAPTRYAEAFFALRALPILETLMSLDASADSHANTKFFYELGRAMRAMRTERWLDAIVGDTGEVKSRYDTNVIALLDLKTT